MPEPAVPSTPVADPTPATQAASTAPTASFEASSNGGSAAAEESFEPEWVSARGTVPNGQPEGEQLLLPVAEASSELPLGGRYEPPTERITIPAGPPPSPSSTAVVAGVAAGVASALGAMFLRR